MPRIKQPHTPPASNDTNDTTLEGCIITFVNSQTSGIIANHADLTQNDFNQLKSDIKDCGGAYAGTVAASTHLVATPEQYEKQGKSRIYYPQPPLWISSYLALAWPWRPPLLFKAIVRRCATAHSIQLPARY